MLLEGPDLFRFDLKLRTVFLESPKLLVRVTGRLAQIGNQVCILLIILQQIVQLKSHYLNLQCEKGEFLNSSRCLLETTRFSSKTPFAFYSISLSMQTKRKTKGNNEILRAFKRFRTQRVRPDIARSPTRFASSKVPGKR